ncbi:MAG: outer membrane protein assembly factor BamD [Dysgonamonadaceae bacterium]|nr:outer membrane protein assembly factor BamD [Dysgonamonadaceae bacterium]MDD4729871.1 outer membrane protein assembly factor BamD [Dysgonamonadaceae bacterium]
MIINKTSKLLLLFAVTIFLGSCGEYNRILKSTDRDLKYTYAKKYFEEKKYSRSTALLEELVSFFKGTAQAEESLYLLGQSYYNSKDYLSSTQIFSTYYNTYPKGEYAEPSLYYAAYGMYLDSPDPQLDQSKTYKAISEFQRYIELYPQTERADQAKSYLFELQEKLAYKELLNAKLYLRLGNYMGNNYESSVITSREALKDYPFSKYAEDFQMLILRARYELAENSYQEVKPMRYRAVIDEYYNYKNSYPQGKFMKEADKYFNEAQQIVDKLPAS